MADDDKNKESSDNKGVKPEDKGGEGGEGGQKPADNSDSKTQSELTDENKKLVGESMKRKERIKELDGELETANTKIGETSKELKKLQERFEGIDPDEVRKLLGDKKDSERKELESKGEYQRILDQVNEDHESKISKLETDFGTERTEFTDKLAKLQAVNRELTIGRDFSNSEFVREELTLTPSKARQIYGTHFEVSEEGSVIAYDKPAGSAERTMIVDGKGKPASFTDAIKKIVEGDPEHDQLIRSKLKTGSGSKTETKKGAPVKDLTGREKIRSGLKNLPSSNQPQL